MRRESSRIFATRFRAWWKLRSWFRSGAPKDSNAIDNRAPVIFKAALSDTRFQGFADFLILNDRGCYQAWDAKLARSPKPYFPVQLCCYSEMLVETAHRSPGQNGSDPGYRRAGRV